MGLGDSAKEWLLRVCVKRGVKAAIIIVSSYMASHGIAHALETHGVTIDWNQFEVGATVSIGALLEMAHDYLKVKKGVSWL